MNDWETYWKDIEKTGIGGQVFWDTDAEVASMEDFSRFREYMDPNLPILDLGCGNGRQTRFLAEHFEIVIGADVSPSAIELAISETTNKENIEYRVFDAVDTELANKLHGDFGDMNIYMRGVLHMIKRQDRANFILSLKILLGKKGTLYQIELASESILHLRALPEDVFASIPKVARRVGFNFGEREKFYPDADWKVLAQGDGVTIRSIPLADGKVDPMPANYLILRRRFPNHD
jgi:SAM-dependent methyltransferase